jgi:hypothetical protein
VWILAVFLLRLTLSPAGEPPAPALIPAELTGLQFTNEFFPGTLYAASVPTPESLLGFSIGQRATFSFEIEKCLKAWTAAARDRTRLVEYARTHERRPLHYVVITAPRNVTRLDEIHAGMTKLGDPRNLTEAEARQLIETLPPVAWLAYTIHGDETEGSDAALAILYHLIAAETPEIHKLLEDVVVVIDPLMNPDGRDRFLKMVAENRGTTPNVDDQSLVHRGYWPWGRGNHYLFDLNRDWIYGVHPETQGRIREVARWNPVLFVDAHGMGPQETHLFSPPRAPINPHIPKSRERWAKLFAQDQARAFDRHGLVYYHGEWNEEWYPGYADSWPAYRGGIGILYEQARVAEDGVRRPEGRILSYRESVFHHVIGSMANLFTLQAHAKGLLENFYRVRQTAVDPTGPYANRVFAVLPTANRSRLQAFVSLMQLQGFELFRTVTDFTAPLAVDQLGRELKGKTLPAGTLLIPNRQPLGHLVSAMLDFDPIMPPSVLQEERKELLQKGKSRIYDTTAWGVTMEYDLAALNLSMELPASAEPYTVTVAGTPALVGGADPPAAYVIDGADDLSVTAAARLMQRGLQVRVAEKPFRFDGRDFARGSVLVTPLDNRTFSGDLREALTKTVAELGLGVTTVGSGYAEGDLPNLGGQHFKRLEPPRVALLSRGSVNSRDFGELWFILDHHLGIRHSQVSEEAEPDLSRYNVFVVPERGGGSLSGGWTNRIKEWVKAGGTLIAIGNSAAQFAEEKADFSKVRTLPNVLGKLGEYELAVFREWMGRAGDMPAVETVWTHQASPMLKYPWQTVEGDHPEEKEMKKRDSWQRLFMPQGAILAARVDTNHWLTFGCTEVLPVLAFKDPVLMAAEGVEAPIRFGYLTPVDKKTSVEKRPDATGTEETKKMAEPPSETARLDKKERKEPPRIGWAALPPGTEMHLRMSGLFWPEAAHRLANSAYLTRESYGRGQIIAFATPPAFRGATRGTVRLLLNAMIYGPGFGAAQPIRP